MYTIHRSAGCMCILNSVMVIMIMITIVLVTLLFFVLVINTHLFLPFFHSFYYEPVKLLIYSIWWQVYSCKGQTTQWWKWWDWKMDCIYTWRSRWWWWWWLWLGDIFIVCRYIGSDVWFIFFAGYCLVPLEQIIIGFGNKPILQLSIGWLTGFATDHTAASRFNSTTLHHYRWFTILIENILSLVCVVIVLSN